MRCGYVEIVKTQLGCPGVDLNLGDGDGCSLLSLVAEVGYGGVVGVLWVCCGYVVGMLFNGANVDPNPVEVDRQIPLLGLLQVGRVEQGDDLAMG